MIRTDGREPVELRPVSITRDYLPQAEGSVLMELGGTKVVCTASFEEGVPNFLKGSKRGWVTAEYSMLPRATPTRSMREAVLGKQGGRTMEIQRLIGRSLRSATDLTLFPERTFWVDCDVIAADGGTRTAAITGAFVALHDAFETMIDEGEIERSPATAFLAAVSVGLVNGVPYLDLCFEEDYHAEMDMNLVADESGRIIEIQGTAENRPVTGDELDEMIKLGIDGIERLIKYQSRAIEQPRSAP